MYCNVGANEGIVRLAIGLIAIILGFYLSPWFYLVAVIAFLTAVLGYCPISHLLGINTCKR